MMNKADLVTKMVEKTGLSKKDTEKALNAFIDTVKETVGAGESVQLIGFGTFEVRSRSARVGRNPRTGEKVTIAAAKAPAFKAGKAFKDVVK